MRIGVASSLDRFNLEKFSFVFSKGTENTRSPSKLIYNDLHTDIQAKRKKKQELFLL